MSRRKQQKPHAVRKDGDDEEISNAMADIGDSAIVEHISDQSPINDDQEDETASDIEDDEADDNFEPKKKLLPKTHLGDKNGSRRNGSSKYVCTYCPASYDTYSQVQNHEQEHADIMPFRCKYCAKGFKHKRSVDRHLKLHGGVKKYKCQHCQTAFFRSDHLKLHLKTHEPSKYQYSCNICQRGFYSPAGLESHAEVHKVSGNLESVKPDSPVNNDSLFSDMMRAMAGQDDGTTAAEEMQNSNLPLVNEESEVSAPSSSSLNLNNHADKDTPVGDTPQRSSSTASGDLQTASSAKSAPPSSISCSVCAALFADVDSLQAHTLRRHSLNEIQRQPSSSASNMTTFLSATASTPRDDDPVYTCDNCRRPFDSILALHSHVATCDSAASATPVESAGAVGPNNNSQIYQCSQCDASLNSLKAFTAHMRQHMQTSNHHQNLINNNAVQNSASPPTYFNCDLCPMVFADQQTLETHLITHYLRKENQYICTDCVENRNSTRIFATKEELFKHLYESHAQMIFRCTVCHEVFDSRDDLQVHFSIHHSNEIGRFRCRSCNALYASDDQFRAHVKTQHRPKVPGAGPSFLPPVNHLNQLPFTCPICLETFAVEYLFDKHVELVHKPNLGPKRVYCSGNNGSLQQQLQKCNICDEKFKDLDQLTKHKLDRHCKVRSEQCNVCKEPVFTVEQFFQHCRLHTMPGCHVTTCVICKQSLNSIVEMQAHAKFHCSETKFTVVDSGPVTINQFKRYQCLKCPLNFDTEQQIQSHVTEHVIQDGLDHQCHLCPENRRVTFDSPAKLQRHLIEHSYHRISGTNELDNQQQFLTVEYKCQMCSVKFDDVIALQNHVTSSGAHVKSHACRYCDQKFFFDTELDNHVIGFHRTMINGAEKPNEETNGTSPMTEDFGLPVTTTPNAFVCPLCGVAFNAMSTLKSHTAQCKRKMFYNNTTKSPSPAAAATAAAASTSSSGNGAAKSESQSLLAQLMMTPNAKPTPATGGGRNRRSTTAAATAATAAPGPFPCPNCPKVFPSMSALQGHSHVHMNLIKAFSCDQCDKNFQTAAKLRNHQRQHTGDKPYMCHICARYFSRRDNLKVHMKTHYKNGAATAKTSDFATSMVVQPSIFDSSSVQVDEDEDLMDGPNFQAADALMETMSPSLSDRNFNGQNSDELYS